MKVTVLVKPNSKMESVTQNQDGALIVKVNAPPTEGKANKRVIELLAKHFNKPKSSIELLRGLAGKKKIFEIS
jgi:uncharacterized protein